MNDMTSTDKPPQSLPAAPALTWMETFTGVLLYPRATFARLAAANSGGLEGFGGAALLVALVFFLDGLRITNPNHLVSARLSSLVSIAGGMFMWLTLTATIAILASCFGASTARIRACLVSLGWSFAPWIFMAPLFCYQQLFGSAFILFALLPTLWVFVLQLTALAEIFQLRAWQILSLVFLAPMLFSLFRLAQAWQSVAVSISAAS